MEWLERLRRINNMVCPWWLCYSFDNPLRRRIHDPERILNPHVTDGMTVVDIVAVDLQEKMLATLGKRACKAGLADRIVLHRCRPDLLGVEEPADFVLAFWMAHEVPDKPRFFDQISAFMKPGGRLLLVEPKFHVTRGSFGRTVDVCRGAGFRLLGEPAIALSRAVRMEKGGPA
jgi:SAM-dependent methyltransferase